jgi:hypothetical protein
VPPWLRVLAKYRTAVLGGRWSLCNATRDAVDRVLSDVQVALAARGMAGDVYEAAGFFTNACANNHQNRATVTREAQRREHKQSTERGGA